MNAPSFLSLSEEIIPRFVLEDLCFDSVFSDKLLEVFQHPCPPIQIKERQEFFKLLECSEYFDKIAKFRALLLDFERIHKVFIHSDKSFSRYWLFIRLLESYCEICDALPGLKGCTLTDRIVGYWFDSEHTVILDGVRQDIAEAEKALNNVSEFDIINENALWLAHDYESISYEDRFISFGKRIGLSLEKDNMAEVAPVDKVSIAFSSLFSNELLILDEMFEKYGGLEFSALCLYINELAFFLEISSFYRKSRQYFTCCYPEVSNTRQYVAADACDLLLVQMQSEVMVPNDIYFTEREAFWFLLGANGGGKTTFLRTVGSNLLLFLCGCPVFAKHASIYPFKDIVSHFTKDERFTDTGRLDEEKLRVEEMLAKGGDDSFLLFNETFSGTDDKRGCDFAISTAKSMLERGMFGLFVTHFHEIEYENFHVLQALVDADNNNTRTFKISRADRDVKSHATDILKKYGLDKYSLAERRK